MIGDDMHMIDVADMTYHAETNKDEKVFSG